MGNKRFDSDELMWIIIVIVFLGIPALCAGIVEIIKAFK